MSKFTVFILSVVIGNAKKKRAKPSGLCFTLYACTVSFLFNQLTYPCSALIRPGRFDMQVTVPKPDVKGRTEILNWYLKKIKVDPSEKLESANEE